MEEFSDIRLEDSDIAIKINSLVHGSILNVDENGIWLDIGKKYDAFLPMTEVTNDIITKIQKNQDIGNITVLIQKVNLKEGIVYVSHKKAIESQKWEELLWNCENNQTVKGKISDYQGNGFIIDLGGEVKGLVPRREIDLPPIKHPKYYLNRNVEGKIIKINPERKQVIISVKEVLEKKQEEKRQNLWEKIKSYEIVRGRVIKISEDSIDLDLGLGIIGTVPKEELSWFPIKDTKKYFDIGDIVKARIIEIDENNKIAKLSIKQTQTNPWELLKEKTPPGSITEGEIIKITSGVVVKIGNLIGYVPASEISWGKIEEARNNLEIGEKIKVKILQINEDTQKILLSIKQVEPNPWEIIDKLLQIGDKVKGKITNITNFGIFVELKPGLEGLIPRRYLSWERIEDLSQNFKIGETIEAVIINIDKENKKLTLSRRELLQDPWSSIHEKYQEGQNVKGTIIAKQKDGMTIEIEPGIEGFLPINHLSIDREASLENFSIEDEIEVKIIRINPQNRRILLSRKALLKEKTEEELKNYLKDFLPPPVTLGDILKFKETKE
ncbi:MAG TPA: S1 RNA-binding domain-containing protein [Dictyoglomaceae bacterium]|nr:S1 RNA-binding domain-containing protein [Dictyoglomaceae bacterium]HOL39611.1 S1 RNA-binding domain-containing protein [Dictyoglomaceae bacterium]HOP95166.1 S1 RNA-binding domain-containing protein [Dictyoglomaceae bacterium]HPP15184.1 S1 RNA-binding domain-containing protein [Dictyoglomaceae bacterium]HPU42590.1 S1 RNA-binding domain-containing protein [Dictyoglomaceae bacterium]